MGLTENADFYKKIGAQLTSWHGGLTHEPCYDRVVVGTAPLDRDLVNTVNNPGTQRLDAVFFTPDVQFRDAILVDPGSVSDHKVWQVKATLVEA